MPYTPVNTSRANNPPESPNLRRSPRIVRQNILAGRAAEDLPTSSQVFQSASTLEISNPGRPNIQNRPHEQPSNAGLEDPSNQPPVDEGGEDNDENGNPQSAYGTPVSTSLPESISRRTRGTVRNLWGQGAPSPSSGEIGQQNNAATTQSGSTDGAARSANNPPAGSASDVNDPQGTNTGGAARSGSNPPAGSASDVSDPQGTNTGGAARSGSNPPAGSASDVNDPQGTNTGGAARSGSNPPAGSASDVNDPQGTNTGGATRAASNPSQARRPPSTRPAHQTQHGESTCQICQEETEAKWPYAALRRDYPTMMNRGCSGHNHHYECLMEMWSRDARNNQPLKCTVCRYEWPVEVLFAMFEWEKEGRLETLDTAKKSLESYEIVAEYIHLLTSIVGHKHPGNRHLLQGAHDTIDEYGLPEIYVQRILEACQQQAAGVNGSGQRRNYNMGFYEGQAALYKELSTLASDHVRARMMVDRGEDANGNERRTPSGRINPTSAFRTPPRSGRNVRSPGGTPRGQEYRTQDSHHSPTPSVQPRLRPLTAERSSTEYWTAEGSFFIEYEDEEWELWKIRYGIRESFELFLTKTIENPQTYQETERKLEMVMVNTKNIPGGLKIARDFLDWHGHADGCIFEPDALNRSFNGVEPDIIQGICIQQRQSTNFNSAPWMWLYVSYDNGNTYLTVTWSEFSRRVSSIKAKQMVLDHMILYGLLDTLPIDWSVLPTHRASEISRRHRLRIGEVNDIDFEQNRKDHIKERIETLIQDQKLYDQGLIDFCSNLV